MTSGELRKKYIEFFTKKGHKEIPSAPLVPENDPTTLFVSAGMQPMLPYLLGEPHPLGTRIVDSQKCIRTADIDEVGDNRHQTFFEMLGNWSFGDYFKKDQLNWIFEFLIGEVGLDPNRFFITVFAGDEKYLLSKDIETAEIWKGLFTNQGVAAKEITLGSLENASEVGMRGGRIFYYDQKKNWWSRYNSIDDMPAGEPGGPNSEMFYEFPEIEHDPKYGKHCHPNCDCGRYLEIGNSVFMQYQKQADGSLKELPNKNVDYGGGLERLVMVQNNQPDIFQTDLFWPIIEKIAEITDKKYIDEKINFRIIADHMKAAVFMIKDGVEPSNKLQGYVLRRLLRRIAVKMHLLIGGVRPIDDYMSIAESVIDVYFNAFILNKKEILANLHRVLAEEMTKFSRSLIRGMTELEKAQTNQLHELFAFNLYQTHGFPYEVAEELLRDKGVTLNRNKFNEILEAHKELSRAASAGMFKGGLADHSEEVTKYHTATHLLHAALRQILGTTVQQKGSNLTAERLRFDFSHPEKLTEEQIKQVEDLVNEKIKENLPVTSEIMDKEEAVKSGALAFFGEKYGDKVTVYTIGHPELDSESIYSREICGGPHVKSTDQLGRFKIIKEESAGAGIRRIYATLAALK